MTEQEEFDQAAFEKWITSPPYEHRVQKVPNDPEKFAWCGQYQDIRVQLAWEAWREARRTAKK